MMKINKYNKVISLGWTYGLLKKLYDSKSKTEGFGGLVLEDPNDKNKTPVVLLPSEIILILKKLKSVELLTIIE